MASTVVELSGDEAKLLRSFRKMVDEQAKVEKSIRGLGDAAGDAEDEIVGAMKNAGEVSAKAWNEPLRELRKLGPEGREMAKSVEEHLRASGQGGRQSMEQVIAALAKLDPEAAAVAQKMQADLNAAANSIETQMGDISQELRKLGPEGQAVAAGLSQHLRAAGKDGSRSMDDVIDALAKLDPEAAKVARRLRSEFKATADDGTQKFTAFGNAAVTKIASIAGAYVGVQQAISTIIRLNNEVIQQNKEIFEGLKQQEPGDRRLLQIAASQEDFRGLRGRADSVSQDYGVDRETSKQLIFSARSEGFERAIDFIAGNSQVIDVSAQAQVAGQIPTLFRAEGLTPEQAINATLAAAQQSRLDFEAIGGSLPAAAEGASLTGATTAETAGALAALASRFKSPETAADRIKAFASKLNLDEGVTDADGNVVRESLADIGLTAAVERLMQMSDADRSTFLGDSSEVNTAYAVYAEELDRIKAFTSQAQAAIDSTGTSASPTAQARAIAAQDASLQVVLADRKAAIGLELAQEENRAVAEGYRQTGVSRELQGAENRDVNPLVSMAAKQIAEARGAAGTDENGAVIPFITNDPLYRLSREADRTADIPLLLASERLRSDRIDNQSAMLSPTDAANLLSSLGGERVRAEQITPEMQQAMTAAIDEAASLASRAPEIFRSPEPTQDRRNRNRNNVDDVALEQLELLRQQVAATNRSADATERQNALAEQQLEAAKTTATNTTPQPQTPPDLTAAQQAAAQQ